MKYLLPVSILAVLSMLGALFIGLTLQSDISVEKNIVVEAPVAIIWNELNSFDNHPKWQKSMQTLYNYNNSARQVRYNFADNTLMANQQVRIRENATSIDFIHIGKEEYSLLKNIGGQIVLTSLADGSSEITWTISYQAESISLRLLSWLYIEDKIGGLISENLNAFKFYLE